MPTIHRGAWSGCSGTVARPGGSSDFPDRRVEPDPPRRAASREATGNPDPWRPFARDLRRHPHARVRRAADRRRLAGAGRDRERGGFDSPAAPEGRSPGADPHPDHVRSPCKLRAAFAVAGASKWTWSRFDRTRLALPCPGRALDGSESSRIYSRSLERETIPGTFAERSSNEHALPVSRTRDRGLVRDAGRGGALAVAAGCGGGGEPAAEEPQATATEAPATEVPPADTAAPPADTAPAAAGPYGAGLQLTDEVIAAPEVSSIKEPWVLWNNETCAYEETTDHPATYEPMLRTIVRRTRSAT